MTVELYFGWWVVPAAISILMFVCWRIFGIRMDTSEGGMFPDTVGAFLEVSGYVVIFLLSIIIFLVYKLYF